jgi:hypothetical protein
MPDYIVLRFDLNQQIHRLTRLRPIAVGGATTLRRG